MLCLILLRLGTRILIICFTIGSIGQKLPYPLINKYHSIQKIIERKADVSKLRIFGSFTHIPGSDKWTKLDKKNTNGIFIGIIATNNNISFEDDNSGCILIHVLFDEAQMTAPNNCTPLSTQILQRAG